MFNFVRINKSSSLLCCVNSYGILNNILVLIKIIKLVNVASLQALEEDKKELQKQLEQYKYEIQSMETKKDKELQVRALWYIMYMYMMPTHRKTVSIPSTLNHPSHNWHVYLGQGPICVIC